MIIGYARVSTKGQDLYGNSLEGQREALVEAGAAEVVEEAFTGATTKRPKFERLLSRLASGDTLIVTKLDRFARTTTEGVETIQNLLDRGVAVRVLNMGLIDNTPTGKLILTVMFAFAEFERELIKQRTQEGKAVKRANGTLKEGRPKKTLPDTADEVFELFNDGAITGSEAAQRLGISRSTLYNLLKTA